MHRTIDFESTLTQDAMYPLLKALTGSEWWRRDSERLGPYLWTSHANVTFKLYDEDGYCSNGPTYSLDVRANEGCTMPPSELKAFVDALLAAIEARNVRYGELRESR